MYSVIRNEKSFVEIWEKGDEVEIHPAWKDDLRAPSILVHANEVYETPDTGRRTGGQDQRIFKIPTTVKAVVHKHTPYNPAQGVLEDVYILRVEDTLDGVAGRLLEIRPLYFRSRTSDS